MPPEFLARDAESPAAPLRKAAMLLHSMAETDRRWMLARLDPAQRPRLEALLAELAALEFPVDADLVRESLAGAPASTVVPAPRPLTLAGWTADEAAELMLREPDDLIALLLRAGDWNWAGALRARLGAARVRAIEASRYATSADVPTVLLEAAMKVAQARFVSLKAAPEKRVSPIKPASARRAS